MRASSYRSITVLAVLVSLACARPANGASPRLTPEQGMGLITAGFIVQGIGVGLNVVTIIAAMFTVVSIVEAVFDSSDPLSSGRGWSQHSLASFETYKMDVLNPRCRGFDEGGSPTYQPDDETLRQMYETAKQDHIDRMRHEAFSKMVGNGLLLLASVGLFVFHWRLARRSGR